MDRRRFLKYAASGIVTGVAVAALAGLGYYTTRPISTQTSLQLRLSALVATCGDTPTESPRNGTRTGRIDWPLF